MEISSSSIDGPAIAKTTLGNAIVLTPKGSLTYETCDALLVALEQASNEPRPAAVIDCQKVSAMDSAALELLKTWHQNFRSNGGTLKLASLNDVCSDILMVTRLNHVFNVCDSVEHAVVPE
jgi:anti-anti-sigma factor